MFCAINIFQEIKTIYYYDFEVEEYAPSRATSKESDWRKMHQNGAREGREMVSCYDCDAEPTLSYELMFLCVSCNHHFWVCKPLDKTRGAKVPHDPLKRAQYNCPYFEGRRKFKEFIYVDTFSLDQFLCHGTIHLFFFLAS